MYNVLVEVRRGATSGPYIYNVFLAGPRNRKFENHWPASHYLTAQDLIVVFQINTFFFSGQAQKCTIHEYADQIFRFQSPLKHLHRE
jgi:hypothetical protein